MDGFGWDLDGWMNGWMDGWIDGFGQMDGFGLIWMDGNCKAQFIDSYYQLFTQSPFRRHKEKISREQVERRIKEDEVVLNDKFNGEAKLLCSQVH